MSHKAKQLHAAGNGTKFPAEAYDYNDDLSLETVKEIRATRGVDVTKPRWKTIDALGQVVSA